jgi:hypothetical protein
LIQPNVSSVEIRASAIAPIGITGDRLPLQGEKIIEFRLGSRNSVRRLVYVYYPRYAMVFWVPTS